MSKPLSMLATFALVTSTATANAQNASTGSVTIANSSSGPITVQGFQLGPTDKATPVYFTKRDNAPILPGTVSNPNFAITFPQEQALDFEFVVMSTKVPNVGCNFRVLLAYYGTNNG